MNVLIADDSYEAVRFSDELKNAGYYVITRHCDVASIKEVLKQEKLDVIVCCRKSEIVTKANKSGLPVLTIKNYNTESLVKKLKNYTNSTDKIFLEKKTAGELDELTVTGRLDGYWYIREAVVLAILQRELSGITKTIYPEIAKRYRTTSACVERSIRNAIDSAWHKKTGCLALENLGFTTKPSNKKLIRSLSEKISAELELGIE